MIKGGLLDEVSTLLKTHRVSHESHSMHSIGYREMLEYISGKKTLDLAIDTAKLSSRRYAKRQLTWFNANKSINWFIDKYNINDVIKLIETT